MTNTIHTLLLIAVLSVPWCFTFSQIPDFQNYKIPSKEHIEAILIKAKNGAVLTDDEITDLNHYHYYTSLLEQLTVLYKKNSIQALAKIRSLEDELSQVTTVAEGLANDRDSLLLRIHQQRHETYKPYIERLISFIDHERTSHNIIGTLAIAKKLASIAQPHVKNPANNLDAATWKYLGMNAGIRCAQLTVQKLSLPDPYKEFTLATLTSAHQAESGSYQQVYACSVVNSFTGGSVTPVNSWEFSAWYMLIDQAHMSKYGQKLTAVTGFNSLPEWLQRYTKYGLAFACGVARRSLMPQEEETTRNQKNKIAELKRQAHREDCS